MSSAGDPRAFGGSWEKEEEGEEDLLRWVGGREPDRSKRLGDVAETKEIWS